MGLARAPLQNPRPEEPTPAGDGATEDATRSSTEDLRDRPPNQLDNETTTDETTPLHHELLDVAHPPAAVPPDPIAVQAPDFPWLDDVLEQIDLELARSSKGKKPTQILDLHKDSSPPVRGSDTHTSTAITKSPEIPVVQNAGGSDNKGRKEQSAGGNRLMWLGLAAVLLFAAFVAIKWTSQTRRVSHEEQSKGQDGSAATNANAFVNGANENSGAAKTIMASQAQNPPAAVGSSKPIAPQLGEQGARPATKKSDPIARSQDGEQEVVVKKAVSGNPGINKGQNARSKAAEVTWLWKATAKGNPDAPIRLADIYIRGDVVPRNCAQAVDVLRTAAINENVRACNRLALMYAVGICVTSNRVEAYRWLGAALAADPNNQWAQRNRDLNWQQMTPHERTLAMKYR
jgi:hypothetical protein